MDRTEQKPRNYQWLPTRIQFHSKSFKTTEKLEIQNSKFKIQIQ